MIQFSKHILFIVLLAGILLSACGETEIVKTDDGGKDDPTRRELQLSFLNKLTLNRPGAKTRAAIATSDEQRIDMLDVYVFGSLIEDGEYTFQEKFSYRADGSSVAGTTALEVTNGDGTSAKPTVLLRPKKGLYIKMFCIANQPELSTLDNATDPANPKYVSYTNFVPLVQTNPGGDNNSVTMGIPTEADFCKLLSRVIDPANKADSIVPALPMVGSCVAPIDLHSFDMASRLSAGIRLVRTVARFDVLNDAATSRFTLESVSMGNGRPVTQLYPLREQKTADDKLITYPVRDLIKMPQVNNNKQLPVFYAYGSPVEDEAYLILKGKYRMNTTETQEVSYKVPFNQVMGGTGSRVAITPNHRYTIAITKADPQHVDFDFTVADWNEGEDLGDYTPDNKIDGINVTSSNGATYDAATYTVFTPIVPGAAFTVVTGANAVLKADILYSAPGNEWLDVKVTMTPVTRTEWSQKATCEIAIKGGAFTAYPKATIRLTNTADGTYNDIYVEAKGVHLGEIKPANGTYNSYDEVSGTLTLYGVDNTKATATIYCPNGLKPLTLPEWVSETHTATGGAIHYNFTLNKAKFPANLSLAQDVNTTINFVDAVEATEVKSIKLVLKSAIVDKAAITLTHVSGNTGNTYTSGTGIVAVKASSTSTTSFRLRIPSAKGATLSTTDYGWFSVSRTTAWSEANKYDEYTFSSRTGQASYLNKSVVFQNTSGGENITLDVTAGVFLGTITGTGSAAAYNTYNAANNTLTLYAINGNAATVKVYSPGTLTVSESLSWLTVTAGADNLYTFALTGTTNTSTGSGVVTFTNASNTSQSTTLTVSLQPTKVETASVTVSGMPAGTTYSGTTMTLNATNQTAFTMTIPSGRGVSLTTTDYSWFTVTQTTAWSESNKKDVYTFKVKPGDKTMASKTVTFNGNVSGGGNYVVTVNRNTAAQYTPIVSGNGVFPVGNYYVTKPEMNEINSTNATVATKCPSGWFPPTIAIFEVIGGVNFGGSWNNNAKVSSLSDAAYAEFLLGFPLGDYSTTNVYGDGSGFSISPKSNKQINVYQHYGTDAHRVRCLKNK